MYIVAVMKKYIYLFVLGVFFLPLPAWGQGFGWTTGNEGKLPAPCNLSDERLKKLHPNLIEFCEEQKRLIENSSSTRASKEETNNANDANNNVFPIELLDQNARDLMGEE